MVDGGLTYQTKDAQNVIKQNGKLYKTNTDGKLEELPKGDYLVYKSGMLNNPNDTLVGQKQLTDGTVLKDYQNVINVNNPTHGIISDGIESVIGWIGIPTGNDFNTKEFNQVANQLGTILNVPHSQANIVEKNANRLQMIENYFSDKPTYLNNINTLSIASPEYNGINQGDGNTIKNAVESAGQKYLGGVNNEGDVVSLIGFNKRENAPIILRKKEDQIVDDGHLVENYAPQLEKPEIKSKILEVLPQLKGTNGNN